MRRFQWVLFLGLIVICLAGFFTFRAISGDAQTAAIVFCPGPDGFGYTCTSTQQLNYIDASQDLELYEDEGLVEVALPFAFSLYGRSFDSLFVSANGNLQFTTAEPEYENECLYPETAAGLGDLIAPYWDDLDLTFHGFLEMEIIGQEPNRVLIIEWDDVPAYDNPEDTVTFEVQLMEAGSRIAFLYQDVNRLQGDRGSSATIGIQSEQLNFALQYGCNQFVLRDEQQIMISQFPAEDDDLPEEMAETGVWVARMRPKGDLLELLTIVNEKGEDGLEGVARHWLTVRPSRESYWLYSNLRGDDRQELVYVWNGVTGNPEQMRLAALGMNEDGDWDLIAQIHPFARDAGIGEVSILATVDLTGDGYNDILLQNEPDGRLKVLTLDSDRWNTLAVPMRCRGQTSVVSRDDDQVWEILRDGCPGFGRTVTYWSGDSFEIH